jgi:hypothetical protein
MKPSLLVILIAALLCLSACAVDVVAPPSRVVIGVEDRPYYVHGPWYVVDGQRWVWVAGHWRRHYHHHRYRRVWMHGTYVRR